MSAVARTRSVSKRISRCVDVEIELDIGELLAEIDDQTLLDELTSRKKNPGISNVSIETIYEEFRRRGDAPQCLRDFIYDAIGKVLP